MAFAKDGAKWGYIDKTGKYVITPQFDEAGAFADGLAKVRIGQQSGYIDAAGHFAIKPQYDNAGEFCEGLAGVVVKGKCGYVDMTGTFVIPPQLDIAGGFQNGLALVKVDTKWGFIDKNGKYVITPQFDEAGAFADGLAKVRIGEKIGYIDESGKFVWEHIVVPPPDFVPYEKAPNPIKRVAPVYPEIARKKGLDGTVWVKIWVGKDGKPRNVVIQKSTSDIFDQAAIDAARQFVFTPAMIQNGPVDVWVSIPLYFRLR